MLVCQGDRTDFSARRRRDQPATDRPWLGSGALQVPWRGAEREVSRPGGLYERHDRFGGAVLGVATIIGTVLGSSRAPVEACRLGERAGDEVAG
jgi:hypothetical protein